MASGVALPTAWWDYGPDTLRRLVADTIFVMNEPLARHVRVYQHRSVATGEMTYVREEKSWLYKNLGSYLRVKELMGQPTQSWVSWAIQREGEYLVNGGDVYYWNWDLVPEQ